MRSKLAPQPFDLKKYLDLRLRQVGERLDNQSAVLERIEEEIDGIERSPTNRQSPTVINVIQAAPGSKEDCHARYESLMSDANAEAMNNVPSGNFAMGRASQIYNQAQKVLAGCR